MKAFYAGVGAAIVVVGTVSLLYFRSDKREVRQHFEREETEIIISNLPHAELTLFKAGRNLQEAVALPLMTGEPIWLAKGNYFLKTVHGSRPPLFYPLPTVGYRGGPDKDGTLSVTIRLPSDPPDGLNPDLPSYVLIPSGHFLFGDQLRRQEPHYVWLGGFFINPLEVTNEEFKGFLLDPQGYADDSNWTSEGQRWKSASSSNVSALFKPADPEFERFGQPDQPVVQVNWFEANAFCRWLTRTVGNGRWIFSLPTEAEWEKAARGPDNFDYGLGMSISDNEVGWYNWRKNPGAEVTVVSVHETMTNFRSNRYGLYHVTGNVAEWTQSVYRTYNRQHPYIDQDDRNKDETPGERVLRGGSWYTASVAVLYIPYRENFRPEVQTPYLGFRVVARPVP